MESNVIIDQPINFNIVDKESNTTKLLHNFRRLKQVDTTEEKREIFENIAWIYQQIHQWKLSLKYYQKVAEIYEQHQDNSGKDRILSCIELINAIANNVQSQ